MKIKITGKELKITEAINDYVEKKLDRIDKYFAEWTASGGSDSCTATRIRSRMN